LPAPMENIQAVERLAFEGPSLRHLGCVGTMTFDTRPS
jgi:hypothetical protein